MDRSSGFAARQKFLSTISGFTGCRAADKIASVLAEVADHRASSIFISALDEIAWLLNIRSSDVRHNPVATAFFYLSPIRSVLFIAPEKLDSDTISYLASEGDRAALW